MNKRKRVATTLSKDEQRLLLEVKRYVRDYCAITSTAEALRYLIRNWSPS